MFKNCHILQGRESCEANLRSVDDCLGTEVDPVDPSRLAHLGQIREVTSSIARVTSVKSSIGIITHQGHISQVSANDHWVSKWVSNWRLSLLERLVTLKMGKGYEKLWILNVNVVTWNEILLHPKCCWILSGMRCHPDLIQNSYFWDKGWK